MNSTRTSLMTSRSLVLLLGLAVSPFTAFAIAFPGPTSCLLVSASGASDQSATSFSSDDATTNQSTSQQLLDEARKRIESTFGKPAASPIVVFLGSSNRIGPFRLNAYGSTQFVGTRTCVMIGTKGRSVDVLAHELMHAELYQRVGPLTYFLEVPTWFDEGVAMQVDWRDRYALGSDAAADLPRVRELTTPSQFFVADDAALTLHYALAKYEVAKWLSLVGRDSLYSQFARLRSGEALAEVLIP